MKFCPVMVHACTIQAFFEFRQELVTKFAVEPLGQNLARFSFELVSKFDCVGASEHHIGSCLHPAIEIRRNWTSIVRCPVNLQFYLNFHNTLLFLLYHLLQKCPFLLVESCISETLPRNLRAFLDRIYATLPFLPEPHPFLVPHGLHHPLRLRFLPHRCGRGRGRRPSRAFLSPSPALPKRCPPRFRSSTLAFLPHRCGYFNFHNTLRELRIMHHKGAQPIVLLVWDINFEWDNNFEVSQQLLDLINRGRFDEFQQ
mmetsp:Transcript_32409/g.78888  ORF Transcript_32409/g.78888 Transcript_32409/m.78888 type:complete len:256 (+) Transcript_32409:1141-1908(+)